MDMIFQGSSMSLFQAKQQWSRMSSWDLKMRFESQLSRMNCQMFSTGLSSGDFGGNGKSVMLSGMESLCKKTPGGGATIALPMARIGVRREITIEPWFEMGDHAPTQAGQGFGSRLRRWLHGV